MKAVMIDRPDGTTALREVDEPPLPGPYDCRCRMVCGTLCAGTDQHILHDRLPWRMPYPLVLGHESVGRVVAVGEKVRHLKAGDLIARVGTGPDPEGRWNIGWGGFAEFGFARDWRAMQEDGRPESEWGAYRIHQVIPPDIPEEAGPLFITLRETLSYTKRLGVGEGARLLLVGSGGNALAFASHARRLGAARIAVLGSAAREDVFRAAGATEYADYRAPAALSGDFTHLIDSVGKADALDELLPLAAPGAGIGIYGLDEWDRLTLHPARARGTVTLYQDGYDEAETHDAVIAGLRAGVYRPELWLGDRRFALDGIGEAFDAVERREVIKPLIRIAAP